MAYAAIVTQLKNVRPHPNADRLQLATVCGNQVIVGLNDSEGDLGIFFDVDGQLSHDFCSANNLYRDSEKNSDPEKKGMFDDNRRVRAQKFRGERSEGFWIPVDALWDSPPFPEPGFEFTAMAGMDVCKKYIPPGRTPGAPGSRNRQGKQKVDNPMFLKHFDTAQFGRTSHMFNPADVVVITEKLHGTSQRVGHVKEVAKKKWYHRFFGLQPVTKWVHLVGTRRVQLDKKKSGTGFYSDDFRERAAEPFLGNLKKGETVYYEVVGYEAPGKLIMPACNNEKLKKHLDKDEYKSFLESYGDTTKFTYGHPDGELGIYVYRITMTNEDGDSVDYSWEAVKKRCGELGVEHVPEYFYGRVLELTTVFEDEVKFLAYGPSHLRVGLLREGVCVRKESYPHPVIVKEKNFHFKVLEGIIKDSGVMDMEEAS